VNTQDHLAQAKPPCTEGKLPFFVAHKTLGEGELLAIRLSQSSSWTADVRFCDRRALVKLDQQYWSTPVSDILDRKEEFAPKRVKRGRKPRSSKPPVVPPMARRYPPSRNKRCRKSLAQFCA